MKVLLVGYYGHQNFGDDLLMQLSLERLRANPSISCLAVTAHADGTEYVKKISPTIDRVEVYGNGRSFLKYYDRVIFGGGGTVFEYRPNLSRLHYWRARFADFRKYGSATLKGTKFASIGLGIGPFADSRGEAIAMNRLRYHDLVFTRDEPSYKTAKRHNVRNVRLSHDLCFLDANRISKAAKLNEEKLSRRICIIVRHYKYGKFRDEYLKATLGAAKHFSQQGYEVSWAALQPQYDEPVLRELRKCGQDIWIWDPNTMSINDVYEMLSQNSAILTARMHGTYLAGMLGIPTVSIGLHPKLELAASYFDNSITLPANPDSNQIIDAITRQLALEAELSIFHPGQVYSDLEKMLDEIDGWICS